MPNPPNFSSWRHFHGTLIRTHNPIVKAYFDALEEEDVNARGGKAPSIRQIRLACTIQVNDSAIVASGKIALFSNYMAMRNNQVEADFYAMPIEDYHEKVQFKPQVMLLFRQPLGKVPEGFRPLEAQIGFRWQKDDPRENDAKSLARDIDNVLGWRSNPYDWERGSTICSYVDPPRGYRLKIYAKSEDEGRNVVEKVLQIQGDTFDRDFFSWSKTQRDLRNGRDTKNIYGEFRKLPRERPTGEVRFYRAELKIWGVRPDVTLVDYSGRRVDLLD